VFKLVHALRYLRFSIEVSHNNVFFRAWSRTARVSRHHISSKRRKITGPRALCNIPGGKSLVSFSSLTFLFHFYGVQLLHFLFGEIRGSWGAINAKVAGMLNRVYWHMVLTLAYWIWRRHILRKCLYLSTKLYDVTSQNTDLWYA